MRKTPFRPSLNREISQTYNSGIVTIYAVTDGAEPGYRPRPVLRERWRLRFEELRLGVTRYYAALQNNVEIERVIRVPLRPEISSQDVAEVAGQRYEIHFVQRAQDVWPASLDLTLVRLTQKYDVSKLDTSGEEGSP